MPPELASKIKSLDAETLQKISSIPPKIWEKLKQLPLEAFDAMLELKASDWDEFMDRWCEARREAVSSRTHGTRRVTTGVRKPKEHGDGPHRAHSRIPVPLSRLPQQRTRCREDQHIVEGNALDATSNCCSENGEECAERKHIGGIRPQRRQRTTQSPRAKTGTNAPVSISTTDSGSFSSEVTRDIDPRREPTALITRRENKVEAISQGRIVCCSCLPQCSKNWDADSTSARNPKMTNATAFPNRPAPNTPNTAVESTADCSSFSLETSTKHVHLSPRCRSPSPSRSFTKRSADRVWWERNMVVSPLHKMIPTQSASGGMRTTVSWWN